MLKISLKNTFILKEVAQPYRSDQIFHMQLQQEALSTTCLGLPTMHLLRWFFLLLPNHASQNNVALF